MKIKKQLKKYQKQRKNIDSKRNYIQIDFTFAISEINKRVYLANELLIKASKELVERTKYYNELLELVRERIQNAQRNKQNSI